MYVLLVGVRMWVPEILVSCVYFEILLVVYEMIDPFLGAPS